MNTDHDDYFPEDQDDEVAFSDALQRIFEEEVVPVHLLYLLSDLDEEQKSLLYERWLVTPIDRRQEVTRHLADLSEDNFVIDFGPVFAYCLADPDPGVRIAALDGLWDTTDLKLITPIIELLHQDQNQAVRAAAAGALSHFLLMSSWGELRGVPVERIGDALMITYRDEGLEVPVRRAALEALGSIPTTEVRKLIEAAYEGSIPELQLGALFAMGNSADPTWLPILLDEMESPYSAMRTEAARASGSVGHVDAVPALSDLVFDEDDEVAVAAIEALGMIGGDSARQLLESLVEDPHLDHLQEAVLESLEEMDWIDSELSLLSLTDEGDDEDDDEPIEFDDMDE